MTLGGDEAPKRNEKTTAFLRKGRSFFVKMGVEMMRLAWKMYRIIKNMARSDGD